MASPRATSTASRPLARRGGFSASGTCSSSLTESTGPSFQKGPILMTMWLRRGRLSVVEGQASSRYHLR
eukprot:9247173-Pyramimonas_sp.AAC.1